MQKRTHWGIVSLSLLAVGAVTAFALWWLSTRYLVQLSGAPTGWVVIEYENPHCPHVPTGLFGTRVFTTTDGYACFSDVLPVGPVQLRVQTTDGAALPENWIQQLGNVRSHRGPCALAARTFFLGPPDAMRWTARDAADQTLDAHHPECR